MKLEKLPKGVRLAVEAAQEKKAGAITVLDLSGLSAFTEYFVICTGYSTPQLQAICSEVEDVLYKEMKRSPEHREGRRSAEWALLLLCMCLGSKRGVFMIWSVCGGRRRCWCCRMSPKRIDGMSFRKKLDSGFCTRVVANDFIPGVEVDCLS